MCACVRVRVCARECVCVYVWLNGCDGCACENGKAKRRKEEGTGLHVVAHLLVLLFKSSKIDQQVGADVVFSEKLHGALIHAAPAPKDEVRRSRDQRVSE